jgi:hypothetical protein
MRLTPKAKEILQQYKNDYRHYFRKCLKIRDKQGNIIKFATNPSQDKLIKIVEDWKVKYPDTKTRPTLYIIILKARQIGFSTTTEGIFFHDLNFSRNMVAMVVSYDEDSAANINDMSDRFYQYLPQIIKPLSRPYRGKGLLFENPKFDPSKPATKANHPGLQNKFLIETARNVNAGSSYTIMRLHVSELAKWPNPKETMTSLLQAVPGYGAIVIVESTAFGMGGYFYDLWMAAKRGENNYTPLFVPWWEHKEYAKPFASEYECQELERTLDGTEKHLLATYGLSLEQLNWRRDTIKNKCNGDPELFKQEYPSNDIEAFLTSGRPVFDQKKLIARLEQVKGKGDRGYLLGHKFVPDEKGPLIIYKHPEKGRPYVIGGDVAEGVAGGDYSVSQVLDNITGEQVAKWRGHIDPDLLAEEQIRLANYYNRALIADEVNNHGLTTVKSLENKGYSFQYRREIIDSITNEKQHKNGFRTDTATRPVIIDGLREIVRERIDLINDEETIGEMLTFIFNDQNKPEAQEGCFDDCVMALAIAHKAREQQGMTIQTQKLPRSAPRTRLNQFTGW